MGAPGGKGSRQWRVRQGSCNALADALPGRSFEQLEKYLENIYYMLFRVIDDIKESVAQTAIKTAKILTRITLQLSDATYSNDTVAKKSISISLEYLLHKGLLSESKTVQLYSLDAINKIASVGKQNIEPHVPELVGILLENLALFEPEAFNYIEQKQQEYKITKEEIDQARLTISTLSPINDTLEITIKYVTSKNIRELTSKLYHALQTAIHFATKAGIGKYLISLIKPYDDLIRKYAGRLLKKLLTKLMDPSNIIRKLYSTAIAHLSKLCTEEEFKFLFNELKKMYFHYDSSSSKNTELHRQSVVTCINELAEIATKRISEYFIDYLPLIYFGCSDLFDNVQKQFKSIWIELGCNSSDRLYMNEIFDLLFFVIENSSSWPLKKQAFLAISALEKRVNLMEQLSSNPSPKTLEYVNKLLSLLLSQFTSEKRIWDGKEKAFLALSSICAISHSSIPTSQAVDIIHLILSECKRASATKEYQRNGLSALNSLFQSFCPPLDVYSEIFEYIGSIIQQISDSSTSFTDASSELDPNKRSQLEKELAKERSRNLLIQADCFHILGSAFPTTPSTQVKYFNELLNLLLYQLVIANWNTKVKILSALQLIIDRLFFPPSSEDTASDSMQVDDDAVKTGLLSEEVASRIIQAIAPCVNDPKFQVVRESALVTLKHFIAQLASSFFFFSSNFRRFFTYPPPLPLFPY